MTRQRMQQLAVLGGGILAATVALFVFGMLAALGVLLVVVAGLGASDIFLGERVQVRRSFWIALLLPFGLLTLFLAERVVGDANPNHGWWRLLSGAALLLAFGWRAYVFARSTGNQRTVEVRLALAAGGVLAALGLYALTTEAGLGLLGVEGEAAERTEGALSALWPAVMLVSYGTLFFMEMAYRVMPIEEAIEVRRIGAAAETGLVLSLSVVFVASITFVATERNVRRDLSYFQTTQASETTLRMVADLDEPVEVVLFYPAVNEVLDQLQPYFDQLDASSSQLTVTVRDHALSPALARQHEVRGNGTVLVLRGEGESQQGESFDVGLDLERARRPLRRLDGTFQQNFAQLTTRPRDLHLTVGHQERSASRQNGDPETARLSQFADALTRANIRSRDLGVSQGLGNEVPDDARAVAVVGPRAPFLPEEAAALLRYVQRGGRLMVYVDPDVDHGLEPLLAGLGLGMAEGVLHSESSYIRRLPPPAALQVVFTNIYSAHPTVTLANRYRTRVASIFDRAGALERQESETEVDGASVTFPLRTGPSFWLDENDDHAQDASERTEARFYVMAAVTVANDGGDEGRAVVVSDGDFITDAYIQNRGNAFILMDTLNWLVGEDRILGPPETEEDVPIEHSRDEDKAWFYGTSFGAPLPLLLVGVFLAMRRFGGRKQAPSKDASTPPLRTASLREDEDEPTSEESE
ncbi:MAG: DUF4350 domain-containing protein [Sandaracinaceae bacterium]